MFGIVHHALDERMLVKLSHESVGQLVASQGLVSEQLHYRLFQQYAPPSRKSGNKFIRCRTNNCQQQVYEYQPDDYVQNYGVKESHGCLLRIRPRRRKIENQKRMKRESPPNWKVSERPRVF